MEDGLQWKATFGGSLHAVYSALQHFFIFLKGGKKGGPMDSQAGGQEVFQGVLRGVCGVGSL